METLTPTGRHESLAGIRAILFDKDGTLLDFEATWGPATASVLGDLAAGDGTLFADMADSCGFLPATRSFAPSSPVIGGHADDFLPAWAALLGKSYDEAFARHVLGLYHAASLASLVGYEDVAAALERLHAEGFRIGLATNDTEATAKAHLERLGVLKLFDFIAGFDSGFGGKPESGMVAAFADAVAVPTSAVAMIGDSPHDMHAAISAGAVPVGIARTQQASLALRDLPALVVPDLAALLRALALRF